MARDYRKIRAWQLADELAFAIYKATESYPKSEAFGIVSQMRRAAVSVPANIVEGASRNHAKEYVQFLYLAMGSLAELGYYIGFSRRVGYLEKSASEALLQAHDETARTLRGLIHAVESPVRKESRVSGPESQV